MSANASAPQALTGCAASRPRQRCLYFSHSPSPASQIGKHARPASPYAYCRNRISSHLPMFGCPVRCKRYFQRFEPEIRYGHVSVDRQAIAKQSAERGASACDVSHAAGRYGDGSVRSISMPRALNSLGRNGFPNLDLVDHLSLLSHCPSHIIPSVAGLRRRDRISIILVFRHHRPDRPSGFVCKYNCDQHLGLAF